MTGTVVLDASFARNVIRVMLVRLGIYIGAELMNEKKKATF